MGYYELGSKLSNSVCNYLHYITISWNVHLNLSLHSASLSSAGVYFNFTFNLFDLSFRLWRVSMASADVHNYQYIVQYIIAQSSENFFSSSCFVGSDVVRLDTLSTHAHACSKTIVKHLSLHIFSYVIWINNCWFIHFWQYQCRFMFFPFRCHTCLKAQAWAPFLCLGVLFSS